MILSESFVNEPYAYLEKAYTRLGFKAFDYDATKLSLLLLELGNHNVVKLDSLVFKILKRKENNTIKLRSFLGSLALARA